MHDCFAKRKHARVGDGPPDARRVSAVRKRRERPDRGEHDFANLRAGMHAKHAKYVPSRGSDAQLELLARRIRNLHSLRKLFVNFSSRSSTCVSFSGMPHIRLEPKVLKPTYANVNKNKEKTHQYLI